MGSLPKKTQHEFKALWKYVFKKKKTGHMCKSMDTDLRCMLRHDNPCRVLMPDDEYLFCYNCYRSGKCVSNGEASSARQKSPDNGGNSLYQRYLSGNLSEGEKKAVRLALLRETIERVFEKNNDHLKWYVVRRHLLECWRNPPKSGPISNLDL